MEKQPKSQILVIGIGNMFRGDDAVGLILAERLKKQAPDHITIIEESGSGIDIMESWKNADTVILIDTVHSGTRPGTIYRFDASTTPLPSKFFCYSTHLLGIAETIELARALHQLPPHLIVYGIEGKCFNMGAGLSTEIEEATQKIMDNLLQEINAGTLSK